LRSDEIVLAEELASVHRAIEHGTQHQAQPGVDEHVAVLVAEDDRQPH